MSFRELYPASPTAVVVVCDALIFDAFLPSTTRPSAQSRSPGVNGPQVKSLIDQVLFNTPQVTPFTTCAVVVCL